jgi:hypothetical protein
MAGLSGGFYRQGVLAFLFNKKRGALWKKEGQSQSEVYM